MPGAEGKRWTVKRAVLGSEEVPVLAGDPALKSTQTEVGHIPVCSGGWDLPPLPCPLLLSCRDRGCGWRCARGGAQRWRRAGKDSVML